MFVLSGFLEELDHALSAHGADCIRWLRMNDDDPLP
jgi:hypothetical protein